MVGLTSAGITCFQFCNIILLLLIIRSQIKGGIIALLDESEEELKIYALEKLNTLVDQFWAEISDAVSKMYVSTEMNIV